MNVKGAFEVKTQPLEGYAEGLNDIAFHRMSIDKQFIGDLSAYSSGEMLSAITPVKGSAGYVALEQVEGTLCGKVGSFVLQHYGIMDRGHDSLILEVVPDSGTGELSGISGRMTIDVESGRHLYDFNFTLPQT